MPTPRSRCAPWIASAILAAATGLTTAGPAVASTVPAVDAPWILYQQFIDAEERFVIALVRADGSNQHALAPQLTTGHQTNPEWSPDATRISFAAVDSDDDTEDLWIVGVDGTDGERVIDCEAPCLWIDDPSWWADGTMILYSRVVDQDGVGVGTLEILHLDTGEIEVLLDGAGVDFYAGQRPSPDGSSIVVEVVHGDPLSDNISGVDLSILDLTSPEHAVTSIVGSDTWPELADWAPDGDLIVFAQQPVAGEDPHDLYTIRPDGTSLTRLTTFADEGGWASHADWTPDGSILFLTQQDRNAESGLAMIDADGSNLRPAVGDDYSVTGSHPRAQPAT